MNRWRNILCALLLAAAAGGLAGCATDTDSSVPWDQPSGWEGPFPSTINQGR